MLENSANTTNSLVVTYQDLSNIVGYNKSNKKEPFYLIAPFCFTIRKNGKRTRFEIPKWFTSDGCTLRFRLLRLLFGCEHTPEYLTASLIHDYFCKNKQLIDRQTATEIFEYVLICEDVPVKKARLMSYWMNLYQKYIRNWE